MIKRCKKCKQNYRHKSRFREYCSYLCAGEKSLSQQQIKLSKVTRQLDSLKRIAERDLWRNYWKWRFINRRPIEAKELEDYTYCDYLLKVKEKYYPVKTYLKNYEDNYEM